MTKTCGNCKHGGVPITAEPGWRRCHLPLQNYVDSDYHIHLEAQPCSAWVAEEPTEYRPSDGPAYATRCAGGPIWTVFVGAHECICVSEGMAREVSDKVNAACREWYTGKPGSPVGDTLFFCDPNLRGKRKRELLVEIMLWRQAFANYGKTPEEAAYNVLGQVFRLQVELRKAEEAT